MDLKENRISNRCVPCVSLEDILDILVLIRTLCVLSFICLTIDTSRKRNTHTKKGIKYKTTQAERQDDSFSRILSDKIVLSS